MIMKKILLLTVAVLLFGASKAVSQSKTAEQRVTKMQEVIEVPNTAKDDIFLKANAWAVKYFVSAGSVIEYSDKDAGTIMGNYIIKYTRNLDSYSSSQAFFIEARDGRVRITIEDPYERYHGTSVFISKNGRKMKVGDAGLSKVNDSWKKTIESLRTELLESTNDDNW